MEHSFNIEVASIYGIEEAILVHNLYFWIKKNVANGKHYYDGRCWTYNSAKAFAEYFPYLSDTKIYRVLSRLEENGFIIKGNYNKDKSDRTKWYSFTDKGLEKLRAQGYDVNGFSGNLQNDEMQFAKMQNAICKNEKSILTNNTDKINTNSKKEDNKLSSKKTVDLSIVDASFLDVVNTWLQYKKERHESYKPMGFKTFYKKLLEMSDNDPNVARMIVDKSMQNNYAGIFPLKERELKDAKQATLFDGMSKEDVVYNTWEDSYTPYDGQKNQKGEIWSSALKCWLQ